MNNDDFDYNLIQAEVFYKNGHAAFENKDYEKARILFEMAVDKHPQTEMMEAIVMLGITLYYLKEFENSVNKLLYSYSSKSYNINYFLGLNYESLGKKRKAIDFFEKCSFIEPENQEIKNKLKKAIKSITEKKINPIQKITEFKEGIEFKLQFKGDYKGEYLNNEKHGFGTIVYPDGRKYSGEFKKDMYNGIGIFTFSNGEKYVGEFKDDKYNGKGTLYLAGGSKYIGEFIDGLRNGKGVIYFANGIVYEGDFQDDLMTGLGKMEYTNGNSYIGSFLCNKMHGKGKYIFYNGNYWEGIFTNGKQNGDGILTTQKNEKYISNYKDGTRILLKKIE